MMHFTVENLEPPNKIENRILQICYSLQKCACFALLDLVLLFFSGPFLSPSQKTEILMCVCVCVSCCHGGNVFVGGGNVLENAILTTTNDTFEIE